MARGNSIKVQPTRDTQFKIEKLRTASLKKQLRKRITKAVAPMPATARAEALKLSRGRNGSRLSRDLANAVGKAISLAGNSVSAQVFVKASGNYSNLARAVEGVILWHHPTFGHEPEQVQSPTPFFFKPLVAQDPRVSREIEQSINDLEKSL